MNGGIIIDTRGMFATFGDVVGIAKFPDVDTKNIKAIDMAYMGEYRRQQK